MFKLFKKKEISICAPFDGDVMDIKDVADPVFSQLMMGDGCAILPTSGIICAPVSGTVTFIINTNHAVCITTVTFIINTNHAVCITTDEGLELIVHYGIDTVKYGGKGFDMKVSVGQKVKAGDILYHCDMEFFRAYSVDLTSPIVVTNGDLFKIIRKKLKNGVKTGEEIMVISKK